MLVPANAFAAAKRFGDLGFVQVSGLHDIECTGEKRGASLLRRTPIACSGDSENAFFSG